MIASESKIKFSQQLKDELVETDPNFKDIFESDSPIEAYLTSKDIKIDSDDSWMLSSFNDSDENVIRNLAVYNIYGANLSKIYDWVDAKEEDMPSLIYNIQEKIFSDQENNTDEPEAKGISRQDLVILGAQAHLTWLCNELWRNIDTLSKRYLGDGKEFRRQMLASYLDMIGEAKATETLDDDYVLAVDFVQILARRDYDNFNSKYEA